MPVARVNAAFILTLSVSSITTSKTNFYPSSAGKQCRRRRSGRKEEMYEARVGCDSWIGSARLTGWVEGADVVVVSWMHFVVYDHARIGCADAC